MSETAHTYSATGDRVTASAKLKPKEHGAYAIIGVPIVTALILSGFTWVGISVSLAAVCGFLAHEPMLVRLGHRGGRAQKSSPQATKRLSILTLLLLISGGIAMAAGSMQVRYALLGCGLLATTSFVLAYRGAHRSFPGQLWGVIGLSAPCVPILLSGSDSSTQGWVVWFAWLIGFLSTTVAVRAVIAAQKQQSTNQHWMILVTLTGLLTALALNGQVIYLTVVPMVLLSWYLLVFPPPARHLKRVGWTLVAGTILSAILMILVDWLQ